MSLEKQDLDMQFGNNSIPYVAIWMVTYNQENYISNAIESVMMQKANFQYKLYIGEDCSTDNTGKICKELKGKYPKMIELFLNEANLGGNQNARLIYEQCFKSGAKYVALLEGDDYWTDPYKLQKQVDFLEANKDYSICFHKVKVWNEEEQKLVDDFITREVPETTQIDEFLKGNYIHTPSVVFRNNFPNNIAPNYFTESPLGDIILHVYNAQFGKIKKKRKKIYNVLIYSVYLY